MNLRTSRAVVVALVVACGGKESAPKPKPQGTDRPLVRADIPEGLDLRLSDGKQGAPARDASKLVAGKKLDDAAVQALLARAAPLATDPADQQAFALRPASQPPPRTGQTIKDSFPPPPSSLLPPAPITANQTLEVVRWMPEGAVPLAPELSVTFSRPMVAVTSQDQAAKTTPVKLVPQPKGRWRWLGTRTIVFDPEVRFPQATTYKVEIPAGTRSADGKSLAKAMTFSFETPPPKLVSYYPHDGMPQHLDVPIFVELDQKIDPKALLAAIRVKVPAHAASGTKDPWGGEPTTSVEIRMLDDKEIAAHDELADVVDAARKAEHGGRWLAFRPVHPLPPDARITVELPAGTPSAEGPNKTAATQSFSFQTYPPLELVRADCGAARRECRPSMPLTMKFNNPLDADKFDDRLVTVTPALPGMKIVPNGSWVSIYGPTKARTTYSVTIGGALVDEFGQKLGSDQSRTFDIGDARPTFYGPSGMIVLDPAATKRTLAFFSTNYEALQVTLYKVQPRDLPAYRHYVGNMWNEDRPPPVPGKKVFDQLVKTSPDKNALVETAIDLTPALDASGFGHALAIVEPRPWTEKYRAPRMIAWVQSTKLAVDAHVDHEALLAFATDLATGAPIAGVELEIAPFGIRGTSDAQGLATLPLGTGGRGPHYLIARRGADVAFVAETDSYWDDEGSWVKERLERYLAWHVFDDRAMYKPGEEVSIKGWLRVIDGGKHGDVAGLAGAVTGVSYRVHDAVGNEILKGTAPVNAAGGFDLRFTLPSTPNLGSASVSLQTQGRMQSSHNHGFSIQEFRRPEFEVSAQASPGPFLVGGGGDVTVSAKYFAGGALPGADVRWEVTATQTTFTPPNRDDYVFGQWQPWWGYRGWFDDDHRVRRRGRGRTPRGSYGGPEQRTWVHEAKTDTLGEHVLHVDFLSAKPSVPFSLGASAGVTDVNRQTWNASTSLIVHPSSVYVGLKVKRPFVEKGTPFDVDVIAVDLDGKARPGARVELTAVRLDWEYKKGRYQTKEVEPQTCAVVAAQDAKPCQFQTAKGGTYQLTAIVVDDKGRPNQTRLTYWVSGGEAPPSRDVTQEQVQLIPDKQEYAVGNTAELLVQAPFHPAEGIVTWRRGGIVKTERITLTGSTASIKVPITDNLVPNLYVQVDLVGMAARTDDAGNPDPKLPKRPAFAVGAINLSVPPRLRTLQVAVTPSVAKLGPGETAELAVEVKDAAGKPVAGAEAAVVVVDESVLSLSGHSFANPVDTFHPQRGADTRDHYERAYVKLARPDEDSLSEPDAGDDFGRTRSGFGPAGGSIGAIGSGRMADAVAAPAPAMALEEAEMGGAVSRREGQYKMKKASVEDARALARNAGVLGALAKDKNQADAPVAVRTNFNPLAAFSPSVQTGPDGKAKVSVKMPDNLTRYRVVAIAVAGDKQFGKGESAITARLPLMVRPSPPRFLNFGDTFSLPVVIQNQTDAPMTVQLAARTGNLRLTDGAGREVSVPANDRVEVLLPAAADMAGTARFQVVGAAGQASDAANLELPVWTPATTEAFATYGVIDDGAIAQPVALPGKVWPQFGGLEVTTASTNLQALTDAVIYLVSYPFDCAEQRSSRILALASLRDVLAAFKSKQLPSTAAMERSVAIDIERLSQMQNYDGGYAYWERGRPSEPYLSVHVTQALVKAKAKGFAVPQTMLDRGRSYLRDIENRFPHYYPEQVRWAISAYALHVRKQLGDLDIAKGKRLLVQAGGVDKVTMETAGWLLSLFAGNAGAAAERQAIVRHALNKVSETAGAANFTTSYGDGNYLILSSDRRVDGVMLEALIQDQKNLDLIPKLVTGLLAHRKRGRWLNTQENAFVLMALDRYFRTYEKVTPNFVARVWLGNDYAGDHAFRGRTTEYHQIDIAMKDVAARDNQNLTIQKDGAGRLYYRVGMRYAPQDGKIAAADYGFVVERRYEAVDDPKQVTRDADGTWRIKAGARVRVRLNMVNENRRYHVALVDPMPAGLEAMNPALATTGPIPSDPDEQQSRGPYWWWYGPWYEHQNMRDERVEAFASLLWPGVHEYVYVARATTPGTFVVPPPKAEEMYMPETFGRGASDRVIVE